MIAPNYGTTSTTEIGFTVTGPAANPKLWRDTNLAFDGRSGSTMPLIDNHYILDQQGSGLAPGTEYSYQVKSSDGDSAVTKLCTSESIFIYTLS